MGFFDAHRVHIHASDLDKEAERQRLWEKYERDETKRRSTQRMSELLLEGAAMTNKHCDNYGGPLFRYEGQVFYPTCQAEGRAVANADQNTEQAAGMVVEVGGSEVETEAEAGADETTISAGSTKAVDETHHDPTGTNGRAATSTRIRTAGERGATE